MNLGKVNMKLFKKALALLVSAATLLCLGISVAAAGTASIEVKNTQPNQTYSIYWIMEENKGAEDAVTYELSTTDEWFAFVNAYAQTEGSGLKLTKSDKNDIYYVSADVNVFSAYKFANAINKELEDKAYKPDGYSKAADDITANEDGTNVKWNNLEDGYYFVKTTSGSICNLTSSGQNDQIIIYDKNTDNFKKEFKDGDGNYVTEGSHNYGDVIEYKITGEVPDTTQFTTYTYKVTDTMPTGITFNKDVKVFVNDTEITFGEDGKSAKGDTLTKDDSGFVFTLNPFEHQDNILKPITITYTGTVNENAVLHKDDNNNTAALDISDDPNTTTTRHFEEITHHWVFGVRVVKTDKADTQEDAKRLAGAEFALYKKVPAEEEGKTVEKFYKLSDDGKTVTWVDDITNATTVKTDAEGLAYFKGLEAGTYYLNETEAPEGYTLIENDVEVIVNKDTGTEGSEQPVITLTTKNVVNNKGSKLPETGGMGTTMIYLIGGMLTVGAAVLLITKKRMDAEK